MEAERVRVTGVDPGDASPAGIVTREAVVKRLLDADPGHLVVVEAPAGHGKTTAIAQWDRVDPRPFAWVALDHLDEDPTHLLRHVARSIERIHRLGDAWRTLEGPGWSVTDRVGALVEALGDAAPMVLVLDDVHLLSALARRALIDLVGVLPTAVQVVLVGRSLWGFPRSRRRLGGTLVEVDAALLAVDDDEARVLFDRLGLPVTDEELDVVLRRTERWIGGVCLATLAMERAGPGLRLGRLRGSDRWMAEYLVEEVLAGLDPHDVEFLEQPALLGRMDGVLLDEVLDAEGSAARLHEMERVVGAFLVPLDEERRWYRYHHLFGELLEDRLRDRRPQRHREVHRRASQVFEARGDVDGAIVHARAAADHRRVASLVHREAPALVLGGEGGALVRWLELVAPTAPPDDLDLALAACWGAIWLTDGGLLGRSIAAAQRLLVPGAGQPTTDEAELALVRAFAAFGGIDGVVRDCELARSAGGVDVNPWWASATAVLGSALAMRGDGTRARALLDAAHPHIAAQPGMEAACLAHLGLLALDDGDRDGGVAHLEAAAAHAEAHRLEGLAIAMVAFAGGSLGAALAGRPERSTDLAGVALAAIDRLGDLSQRTALICLATLARAALARGDRDGARALVARAERVRRREPLAARLNEHLDELHHQLGLGADVPAQELTAAELRVLPLLATHLSLKEIAGHLVVSRNTVKTHTVAIYRKLGVSSRSGAVAEARRRALIPD